MAYFDKYGVEFTDDRKTLVKCPRDLEGEYIIPDGVISIGNSAFGYNLNDFSYSCQKITSVIIPNSVTSIGAYAFADCSGLVSIEIPNSVISIGKAAFYDCSSLTSITIPNSVTSIGDYAFIGCNSLPSIDIPNSVTSIGNSAFVGCTALTSINIPNSVIHIGEYAFQGCSVLASIVIPNSVTCIGRHTFSGFTGLTSVTIPDSVTIIDYGAFRECIKLKYLTIPDSVKEIGECAFYDCSSLEEITLPKDLKVIPNWCFRGCEKLKRLVMPNSVKMVGSKSLLFCNSLTELNIPEGVEEIGDYAIWQCKNLKSIKLSRSIQKLGENSIRDLPSLKEICIPQGQKARFLQMGLNEYEEIIAERDSEELTILLNLAKAYEKGIGVNKSITQAYLLHTQAAEKGSAESAFRLAEWYNEGEVIPRDLNKALTYFQQAAKSGYQGADMKAKEVQELIDKEMQQMEEFLEEERNDRAKALQQREEAEQKKREDEDRKKRAEEERNRAYYLFFDTETSGLPPKGKYDASPTRSDIWPRLVQIAWLVTNKDGMILKQRTEIIYPADFFIPPEATKIHGITTEQARREGKFIHEVLEDFEKDLSSAQKIVCHNVMFDQHVLGAEMYRLKMDYEALMNKPSICTMLSSTNFCAIPNLNGYDDYKWPKLSELYNKLFNRDFDDAHDALADITATKDCFFELKRRGII